MTREEAIDVLKHNYPSSCFTDLCEAVDIAIQALSAQSERKRGKWIDQYQNGDWHCSCCGAIVEKEEQMLHNWYFCYHCGALMDERNEDVGNC